MNAFPFFLAAVPYAFRFHLITLSNYNSIRVIFVFFLCENDRFHDLFNSSLKWKKPCRYKALQKSCGKQIN